MRRMKLHARCSTLHLTLALSALVLISAGPAMAYTFAIGGGWEVMVDDSYITPPGGPYVDVTTDFVTPGVSVEIQKAAEFLYMNPIVLTFNQVAADAVPNIILNDETITNSTGLDWSGFIMELIDDGDASFDPASAAGFSISPFTNYSLDFGDTKFTVDGGVVVNGATWFPGAAMGDGQLIINTTTGAGTVLDPFTTFSLKENPVPEPATLSLVALGLVAMALRARRT